MDENTVLLRKILKILKNIEAAVKGTNKHKKEQSKS